MCCTYMHVLAVKIRRLIVPMTENKVEILTTLVKFLSQTPPQVSVFMQSYMQSDATVVDMVTVFKG